jgi:hypothetical protein
MPFMGGFGSGRCELGAGAGFGSLELAAGRGLSLGTRLTLDVADCIVSTEEAGPALAIAVSPADGEGGDSSAVKRGSVAGVAGSALRARVSGARCGLERSAAAAAMTKTIARAIAARFAQIRMR